MTRTWVNLVRRLAEEIVPPIGSTRRWPDSHLATLTPDGDGDEAWRRFSATVRQHVEKSGPLPAVVLDAVDDPAEDPDPPEGDGPAHDGNAAARERVEPWDPQFELRLRTVILTTDLYTGWAEYLGRLAWVHPTPSAQEARLATCPASLRAAMESFLRQQLPPECVAHQAGAPGVDLLLCRLAEALQPTDRHAARHYDWTCDLLGWALPVLSSAIIDLMRSCDRPECRHRREIDPVALRELLRPRCNAAIDALNATIGLVGLDRDALVEQAMLAILTAPRSEYDERKCDLAAWADDSLRSRIDLALPWALEAATGAGKWPEDWSWSVVTALHQVRSPSRRRRRCRH